MSKPAQISLEQVIGLATEAYILGHAQEAEQLCSKIVEQLPEHAHAWYLRGLAAEMLGDLPSAQAHLAKVKNAPDLLTLVRVAQGRVALGLGESAKAHRLLKEALAYTPDDPDANFFMGVWAGRQHDAASAEKYFRRCTRAKPEHGHAHYELGVLALQGGHFAAAADALARAFELLPKSAEAANNLGIAHQSLGDFSAAEDALREAVNLKPDYAAAWMNLGLLLRNQGKVEESRSCIDRALTLAPELETYLHDQD